MCWCSPSWLVADAYFGTQEHVQCPVQALPNIEHCSGTIRGASSLNVNQCSCDNEVELTPKLSQRGMSVWADVPSTLDTSYRPLCLLENESKPNVIIFLLSLTASLERNPWKASSLSAIQKDMQLLQNPTAHYRSHRTSYAVSTESVSRSYLGKRRVTRWGLSRRFFRIHNIKNDDYVRVYCSMVNLAIVTSIMVTSNDVK
jgi:hypothetical protein